MFTGIVTDVGKVVGMKPSGRGVQFRIRAPKTSAKLHIGGSVSLNGACHTVVRRASSVFEVQSVAETLKKTALRDLRVGSHLNLELPMAVDGRFEGHIVLGHVDTFGSISAVERNDTGAMVTIAIAHEFSRYVVPVGSIAVDGVSLTVARLRRDEFTVAIIPHTLEHTIFNQYKKGTRVNIEFDILGKYIERMLDGNRSAASASAFPSTARLKELGF